MSDQDTQLEESIQPVSPGAVLAGARNSQGLSIAEVAENLKITESYVRAIEDSAFDALPQAAFVRGYIRNYARLVGLGGEELVKDFDCYIGNDGLDAPRLQGSRKIKPLRAHSAPSPAHALALLLVVSLGGLSYYLWNEWLDVAPAAEVVIVEEVVEPAPETIDSTVQATQATTVKVEQPVAEETSFNVVSEPVKELEQALEMPEFPPIAVESADVAESSVSDNARQPVAKLGKELVIDFSEDCWVEIKDATGGILVSTVQKAGSSINLDVFPPVSVRFGNTSGVKNILFDDKPVRRPNSSTRVASVLLTGNGQG